MLAMMVSGCNMILGIGDLSLRDAAVDGADDGPPLVCSGNTPTQCGDRCVDLMTDSANCGACGYGVISAESVGSTSFRECVAGKPTPGWVTISDPPAAIRMNSLELAAWTGRRMLVIKTDKSQLSYSPDTNTWTVLAGGAPLVDERGGGQRPVVADPAAQRVYVWADRSSPALAIFQDGTTPAWMTAPLNGTQPRIRMVPALALVNGGVYVVFGSNAPDGGALDVADRFDTTTMTWQSIATDPAFTSSFFAPQLPYNGRVTGPLARAGTSLVTLGGGTNAGDWADTKVHTLDTGALAWGATFSGGGANASVTPMISHALLATQGRVIAFSGRTHDDANDCKTLQTLVVNPATKTITATQAPPLATSGHEQPWAFDLGRAAMMWGGWHLPCDSNLNNAQFFAGGALGIINTSQETIQWIALPGRNQPQPQGGAGTDTQGSSQQLWTGREAIVWGGLADKDGASFASGSRYQPPVGCVCPSSELICNSVEKVASPTCDPSGQ
jgi:hypothetical protein